MTASATSVNVEEKKLCCGGSGGIIKISIFAFLSILCTILMLMQFVQWQHAERKINDLQRSVRLLEQQVHQLQLLVAPALQKQQSREKRDISSGQRSTSLPAVQYDGFRDPVNNRHHFTDWKLSNWTIDSDKRHFYKFENGSVQILQTGLYFVYSQIYYLDEFDEKGYKIFKNQNAILFCVTSTHSITAKKKGATCHTSGIEEFQKSDLVYIKDISNAQLSILDRGKSFFGLIKIS